MAQYINKDDFVEEIERRQRILDLDSPFGQGGMIELELIKEILSTIEVKEVDLEKELSIYWNEIYKHKDYSFDKYNGHYISNITLLKIIKHFFELGLKVQKGE